MKLGRLQYRRDCRWSLSQFFCWFDNSELKGGNVAIIKLAHVNATPLIASLLLCATCAILSACSTTQEPPQYSLQGEFCIEGDATDLDCRHFSRDRENLNN